MFEPQSGVVFLVLAALFGGAIYWLIKTRRIALKLFASFLAFTPAVVFGMAIVNSYYGYYQSWDDVWRDLANEAPANVTVVPDLGTHLAATLDAAITNDGAKRNGFAMETTLAGDRSGISRVGIIYLPPQYFQPKYAHNRFPVLELIHGTPGEPSDYEAELRISQVLRTLVAEGKAKPVVLVMPDANGGPDRSTQCLDLPGKELDDTYLSSDIPALMAAKLRVDAPGQGWGIAGYSEGGYCAANLALRHPGLYDVAGALSGYFQPLPTVQLRTRDEPFRDHSTLRLANDPMKMLAGMQPGAVVPKFWVMAGSGVRDDMVQAREFVTVVRQFQPNVPYMVIKGGLHDFAAWKRAFPPFFAWATPRLWASQVCHPVHGRPC